MEQKYDNNPIFCLNYLSPDFSFRLSSAIKSALAEAHNTKSIVGLCIGTDKSVADSFGPLCGSKLINMNAFPCYGSINKPVTMHNVGFYADNIFYSYPRAYIIAVDAAKSESGSLGDVVLIKGPIVPGAAGGERKYSVGRLSIIGITEKLCFNKETKNNSAKLSRSSIVAMSEAVAMGLYGAVCR